MAVATAAGLAATMTPSAGAAPRPLLDAPTKARAATTGTTPAAPTSAARVAPTRFVTLPSGDRIGLRNDGVVVVTPAGQASQQAGHTVRLGASTYVFPEGVREVLGGVLDPELFNVTALAARRDGRTPVAVTYASASAPTAVPGVETPRAREPTAAG